MMAAILAAVLFEAIFPETERLSSSEMEFVDPKRVGSELRDAAVM